MLIAGCNTFERKKKKILTSANSRKCDSWHGSAEQKDCFLNLQAAVGARFIYTEDYGLEELLMINSFFNQLFQKVVKWTWKFISHINEFIKEKFETFSKETIVYKQALNKIEFNA